MTAFVVDASVAAKWYLPSKDEMLVAEARQLLDSFTRGKLRLFVPDLFWAEMGNLLWKAVRTGKVVKDVAVSSMTQIRELNLPTYSSYDLLPDALQIALRYDRPVYDSLYVALAVRSATDLITADERLANALAAHLPVKWLGIV